MLRHMIAAGSCVLLASSTNVFSNCPDADGNQTVDVEDLLQLIQDWGPCVGCSTDFDGSGNVDVTDLLELLEYWGDCEPGDIEEGDGLFNYGEALQKAMTFYYANRAGDLPENYPLNWRGDCFTDELEQRNGQYSVDAGILNRYMDAGDSPTFVLPISSAMTTMAWSGVDFREGFVRAGLLGTLKDVLRWHADWCLAAHPEPNVFCGQIGLGGPSHAFWGPAEIHTEAAGYEPVIWWLNPENPGTEPAAEAAAFLAAASMVFRSDEPAYADLLLQNARELYSFADTYRGKYTASIPDVTAFYNSWSGYHDELTWAATWLHRATGEADYLARAEAHYQEASPDPRWAQSWDGKINGAAVLLAHLTGKQSYRNYVEGHLDYWMPGGGISYTPGGLAWLDTWGSLRYAANSSFIAFAYAELVGDKPDGRYQSFGESQINYILGDNPRQSSYVCGFGTNPPQRPHHRGAHGSWNNQIQDPGPNRHTLWGALVGGPASADDFDYADVRSDYIANEVACDYNAGFTAALGRMSRELGGDPLPASQFPPVEDSYGQEMFVEASVIESGDTYVKLRCMLNNRSAWPARFSDGLAYRIYVDLSEVLAAGFSASDVVVDSGFLDGGAISGLQAADPSNGLYYVEVNYLGESIGPGQGTSYRRECQVRIGLPSGSPASAWDTSNDPSIANLPFGQSAIAKTETISVFEDGNLIYGEEGVSDCNNNGIPDSDDLANGSSGDLDGNGLPDECDPDCNGDGQPDAYEIQQGQATDCDSNGVPDSCEDFGDCDGNGVADGCEIADGTATDCNGNGVPDECDISSGNASDADGDGILDGCQLGGLVYDFTVTDQWDGGFTAKILLSNNSGEAINDWTLVFDVPYQLTGLWPVSGSLWGQDTAGTVTVNAEEWNATISDGSSLEIGFQGSGAAASPSNVILNGIAVEELP